MLPVIAAWPPKIFTPRRLLCESRPFFTLPSPFLCAIQRNFRIQILDFRFFNRTQLCDVSYFNFCVQCAVSFLFMKSFSSFLFVGDHSIAFGMTNYLCADLCL